MMMKRILLCISVILIFCGTSYADIAYTTSDGGLGLIKITGAKSADAEGIKYQGGSSNPLVAPFWDGSNSNLILIDRTNDTTTSGDTARTFRQSNMSTPLETEARTLEGVYGTRSAAYSGNGRALFLSSGTKITQISTENFAAVRSVDVSRDYGAVRDIIVYDDRIYAMADSGDNESAVLRFDGQLKSEGSDFGKERIRQRASSMSMIGSRFALTHQGGVYILEGTDRGTNISSDNPVVSMCQDNGNGFYCITQASGDCRLLHYSAVNSAFTTLLSGQTGGNLQVIKDSSYNSLGVIIGGGLRIYNMADDTLIGSYESSVLGGTPVNMAITTSTGSSSNDSSSSGCNSLGAAMIAAVFGVFLMGRKKI